MTSYSTAGHLRDHFSESLAGDPRQVSGGLIDIVIESDRGSHTVIVIQ